MTCFVNEAGSKIGNDWRSDRTQSFNRSLFGEAAYLVIRWVNFEKQSCVMQPVGCLIVSNPSAIGGSYFNQLSAGFCHYVRHPEAAPDLYKFATRYRYRSVAR